MDFIQLLDELDEGRWAHEPDMRVELDEVYAQAAEYKEYRADTEKLYNALKAKGEKEILKYKAKADEYEAKAKALDRIVKLIKKEEII